MISRRVFLAVAGCATMMAAQQKGGKAKQRSPTPLMSEEADRQERPALI